MSGSGGETGDRILTGFAFRCDRIRSGDVLLCTDAADKMSGLIRIVTGGTFSHAAICTVSPLFIEADFDGVAEFSLNWTNVYRRASARVLRLKAEIPGAAAVAEAAARAALDYQTSLYDKVAAVASVFGGAKATSGVFCSYLVASAYAAAGRNITVSGKSPATTTPADIELSGDFDDITASVLIPAELDPSVTHFFLDRAPLVPPGEGAEHQPRSPAQEYNAALRAVADRVASFLATKGRELVKDYLQAERALVASRDEVWFEELDSLFAASLRELALPVVAATRPIVRAALLSSEQLIRRRLEEETLDAPSLRLTVLDIEYKIDTTQRLILGRSRDAASFRAGNQAVGWKSLEALIECEEAIVEALRENLQCYHRMVQSLTQHAVDRRWTPT